MRELSVVLIWLTLTMVAHSQPIKQENETGGKELYNQAKSYVSKGDLSNAIMVFNQAIQKEPKNLLFRRELAFTYFLQGDMLQAAQIVYPLMKAPEADPETFLLASKIFRKVNRLDEATDAIHAGIKKYPNQGMLYEEKGQVLMDKKKNKEAVGTWENGVKKSPEYYMNYYDLSRAYFYNKEYIWAIMYGEHFVNMESFTNRSEEIKKIIFESYKSLIAELNSEEIKNANQQNSVPKTFEDACRHLLGDLKNLVTGGINMENLGMLRLRFILTWNRDYARRYPLELIDYQQRMILNGCYDGYNMWLFGKADNEQNMKAWTEENTELMNKFDTYFRNNKLQPKPNQYYHR